MTDDRFIVIAATADPGWRLRDTLLGVTLPGRYDSLAVAADMANRWNEEKAA